MSDFFSEIINVSIYASALILAVIIYRIIFRKAPKWINCILWGIVALRLVIPVKISSIFGTLPNYNVFNMGETLEKTYISSGNYAIDDAVNGLKETYEVDKLILHDMDLLPMIWIIGIAVMLAVAVAGYLNIAGKTRVSIKSEEGYYLCDDISTPFILGFISPKIYIPSAIDKAFLNGVIAHEKAHIRRRDYIWKLIGYLILTVYWFNPVVWVAYILLCRDIEYACDEKVIAGMSKDEIADYSQALLNFSDRRKIISFCPVAFGNVGVKQRIKSVFNYKKPSFWIIIVALIASVSLILVFATNQKENVEPDFIEGEKTSVCEYLDYGFRLVENEEGGNLRYGVINDKNEIIVPYEYDIIKVITDNLIIARKGVYYSLEKTDVTNMFDKNGNRLNETDFNDITFFDGNTKYGIGAIMSVDNTVQIVVIDAYGKEVSKYYEYEQLNNVLTKYEIMKPSEEVTEESTTAPAVIINDGYTKASKENKSTTKVQSTKIKQMESQDIIDSITADYDNDGVKETIQVLSGPTSGLYTLTVKVIDGKNEYSEVFMPENQQGFDNIRLTEKDGKVYFNADDGGKTETYRVMVNNNDVVLKSDSKEMPYWGGRIRYYVTEKTGKETEISYDESVEIFNMMNKSEKVNIIPDNPGKIKIRLYNSDYYYDYENGMITDKRSITIYFSDDYRQKFNSILKKYNAI